MRTWMCLLLMVAATQAQTTTTYRGIEVQSPDPTGAGGLRLQNNFKSLADRIGNHIEAADDPTADDDEAGTGGEDPVMKLSTWRNTSDNGLWVCLDATTGAAVWTQIGVVSGGLGIGGSAVSGYPLTAYQTADDQGIRIYGYDDQSAEYVALYLTGSGSGIVHSSGEWKLHSDSGALHFNESRTGNAYFFPATTGNPKLYVYGHNGATTVGGSIYIDAWGEFNIVAPAGEALKLASNAGAKRAYIEGSTGDIWLPDDNQEITFGPGKDYSIDFNGTNAVHSLASGNVLFDAPVEINGVVTLTPTVDPGLIVEGSGAQRIHVETSAASTANIRFKNANGYWDAGAQADGKFMVYDYGASTNRLEIARVTGDIALPADSQKLSFGAAGTSDSYLQYTGTRLQAVSATYTSFSVGGNATIDLQSRSGHPEFKAGTSENLYFTAGNEYTIFTSGQANASLQVQASGSPSIRLYNSGTYIAKMRLDGTSHDWVFDSQAGSGTTSDIVFETDAEIGRFTEDKLTLDGALEFAPSSSETPTDNGDVVIEATSNTTLTFKLKGSDGTVRSAALTLAP